MDTLMPWYRDLELLRGYMRAVLVMFFMGCLLFILIHHVGLTPMETVSYMNQIEHLSEIERARAFELIEIAVQSQIPAGNVWSWITGLVAGTLVAEYFGKKAVDKIATKTNKTSP